MDLVLVRNKYQIEADGRDWKLDTAIKDIKENEGDSVDIFYRPFDVRKTFYTGNSKGFHAYPKDEVMRHLRQKNYALVTEKYSPNIPFSNVYLTKAISDAHLLGTAYCKSFAFPLYLYPADEEQLTLGGKQHRVPNLDKKIIAQIAEKLGILFVPDNDDKKAEGNTAFSPLDLLDYIYAVLHSPTYRETYKEFLKIDFPRIPYPADAKTFWQLAALGRDIRLLHLLESPKLAKPITSYPVGGDNKVEKPEYKAGRVYINKDQYFDGVPQVAWDFYIGGYQPAQKWLKDRKCRNLNFDDITHYQKIIVALAETDRLMKEIDAVWKP